MVSLSNRFPGSSALKRHLAYFNFLLGKKQDTIAAYKDVAALSQDKSDWHNVAVLALKTGKEELACYALEKVFCQVPITDELDVWYVYLGLLKDTGNWPALSRLSETTERNLLEEELLTLLETGIYLLKVTGKEEVATILVHRWLEGQALQPLAMEAFNQLEGQPSEAYIHIVNEFSKKDQKKTEKPIPTFALFSS